eukprot:scaffold1307_cov106-Isochrysis_galbana.AAC.2
MSQHQRARTKAHEERACLQRTEPWGSNLGNQLEGLHRLEHLLRAERPAATEGVGRHSAPRREEHVAAADGYGARRRGEAEGYRQDGRRDRMAQPRPRRHGLGGRPRVQFDQVEECAEWCHAPRLCCEVRGGGAEACRSLRERAAKRVHSPPHAVRRWQDAEPRRLAKGADSGGIGAGAKACRWARPRGRRLQASVNQNQEANEACSAGGGQQQPPGGKRGAVGHWAAAERPEEAPGGVSFGQEAQGAGVRSGGERCTDGRSDGGCPRQQEPRSRPGEAGAHKPAEQGECRELQNLAGGDRQRTCQQPVARAAKGARSRPVFAPAEAGCNGREKIDRPLHVGLSARDHRVEDGVSCRGRRCGSSGGEFIPGRRWRRRSA